MQVETHSKLRPQVFNDCSRVVVRNGDGVPIFVAVNIGNEILYSTVGDPDFNQVLQSVGIKQTVIVQDIKPQPLDKIQIL